MGFGVSFCPKYSPLYSARPQANRWDLAWRTQTAKFSSPAAQTRRPSARLTSLKAQDRAKLRRSETTEAAPSAEQTQTADQEDQEQAKEDQGLEEEKVWCTLSESVDSMYI